MIGRIVTVVVSTLTGLSLALGMMLTQPNSEGLFKQSGFKKVAGALAPLSSVISGVSNLSGSLFWPQNPCYSIFVCISQFASVRLSCFSLLGKIHTCSRMKEDS
jgi:hypothetical protein